MYGHYTKDYIETFFNCEDANGKYQSVALTGPGIRTGDSGKEWKGYNPTSVGRHWQPASYLYDKYKKITGEDLSQYPLIERLNKFNEIDLIHWGKKGSVPRYKYYLDDAPGVPYQDIWAYQPGTEGCIYSESKIGIDQDVKWLSTQDKERLGYPTQKPEGILERMIRSSCPKKGLVLDPFCGCGTTISVAERLNRKWIGIDITHLAISLIKHRLHDAFGIKVKYEVIGEPVSLSGARELAKHDRFQFQWWASGLVGARPIDPKKGADKGIDGRLYFHIGSKFETKQIIISVKSGRNVSVKDIRDLRGVIEREKAVIGVLITLEKPSKPMKIEALNAGFYTPKGYKNKYPRIQILTITELLDGKKIDSPKTGNNYRLKEAEKKDKTKQSKL